MLGAFCLRVEELQILRVVRPVLNRIEAPTSKITMQNQKYNAMAKMDVNSGSLDTPDEQGVTIQPDLQIKEFLRLFLCHQGFKIPL